MGPISVVRAPSRAQCRHVRRFISDAVFCSPSITCQFEDCALVSCSFIAVQLQWWGLSIDGIASWKDITVKIFQSHFWWRAHVISWEVSCRCFLNVFLTRSQRCRWISIPLDFTKARWRSQAPGLGTSGMMLDCKYKGMTMLKCSPSLASRNLKMAVLVIKKLNWVYISADIYPKVSFTSIRKRVNADNTWDLSQINRHIDNNSKIPHLSYRQHPCRIFYPSKESIKTIPVLPRCLHQNRFSPLPAMEPNVHAMFWIPLVLPMIITAVYHREVGAYQSIITINLSNSRQSSMQRVESFIFAIKDKIAVKEN